MTVLLNNRKYTLAIQIGAILNHLNDNSKVLTSEYCYLSANTSLVQSDIITNSKLLVITQRNEAVS